MIIVAGDTPSSVEINAWERIGDPSKMAAVQYVGSNMAASVHGASTYICLWLPLNDINVIKTVFFMLSDFVWHCYGYTAFL